MEGVEDVIMVEDFFGDFHFVVEFIVFFEREYLVDLVVLFEILFSDDL